MGKIVKKQIKPIELLTGFLGNHPLKEGNDTLKDKLNNISNLSVLI